MRRRKTIIRMIPELELPIKIRKVFTEEENCLISSGNIKEIMERLRQDPGLQTEFTDDVEKGKIIQDESLKFSDMSDFAYVDISKREMSCFEKFVRTSFPYDLEEKKHCCSRFMVIVSQTIQRPRQFFSL